MMYASILTFVVSAYLVVTVPGDLSYVRWFEIESVNEIHGKIDGESWELFKIKHNKQYTDIEEEAYRHSVFIENMMKIDIHNEKYKKGEKSYWLGVNHFSDLGLECASCWAFSTTGSLKGQNFHKTGKLVSLSEQQLVDCSTDFGNLGCKGGFMDKAFEYIKKYGIGTEKEYPYKAKDQQCKYNSSKVVAKNTGCMEIESGNELALQQAVATIGPISVSIDANHSSFYQYSGGVYEEDECSSTELDHGVLAVGYGTEDGKDYWLVKNSWSEGWGENGYVKIARNKGNMCGIATASSYRLL